MLKGADASRRASRGNAVGVDVGVKGFELVHGGNGQFHIVVQHDVGHP